MSKLVAVIICLLTLAVLGELDRWYIGYAKLRVDAYEAYQEKYDAVQEMKRIRKENFHLLSLLKERRKSDARRLEDGR